jgi:hypothetical protein
MDVHSVLRIEFTVTIWLRSIVSAMKITISNHNIMPGQNQFSVVKALKGGVNCPEFRTGLNK